MSGCHLNVFPSNPPQAPHAGHRTSSRPDPRQPARPEDRRAHRRQILLYATRFPTEHLTQFGSNAGAQPPAPVSCSTAPTAAFISSKFLSYLHLWNPLSPLFLPILLRFPPLKGTARSV